MAGAHLSGRCYCGAVTLTSDHPAITVTTCHCVDCRRVSGAPINTFAALRLQDLQVTPPLGTGTSHSEGVRRWSCAHCGTPLAAVYDYLPGQIYVPVGLFDQADCLVPESESHIGSRLSWVADPPDIPHIRESSRNLLNRAHDQRDG